MLKLYGVATIGLAAAAMSYAVPVYSAEAGTLGPHAQACRGDGPAVIAHVSGFKTRSGTVRVQLYSDNPATFLEKGKYLSRVDVPVTASGAMNICVPVPKSGRYALSVRHDVDGNGKTGRADGGGFSGNPNVSLGDMISKRKPDLAKVVFPVGSEPTAVSITLRYVQGLSFRPVNS